MLSLRWLKGFLTQKLSERCSWLSQKHLNSCKVCTKKKNKPESRRSTAETGKSEEQQKCRRRRGSAERESTRERIQRAEVTSWKPSVTKLEEMFWGRSRLLELKSCFIFSSDVRWCQMMWDDWQTEWITPQMDVKPSRLINRWTTVLESVWISK